VLLVGRLREAINRLNPLVPPAAREDALHQVLNLDTPVLLAANRAFHHLLINDVPVEYQKDGETLGDFVRLIDFEKVNRNDWLAVNQFSVKGPKFTRRPDIVLFLNGLPLVLLELKNPADTKADLWMAYDQIETYKEQIPDIFRYNELLVITDGSENRDTRAIFGDYIHIYDMQQSRTDGATVPIYFESRLAKLGLNQEMLPEIDDEVDELAEDEEEDEQKRLKRKWAALEKVVGAEPRIKLVAADLVAHFEERNKAPTGKAMIVAMSRDICAHLYNAIVFDAVGLDKPNIGILDEAFLSEIRNLLERISAS
jgi:type I site-specific restriction-modification system R (restriction) subunit